MNNVLVFGASGRLGNAVVAALVLKGFCVTACVRNPALYAAPQGVRVVEADAMDVAAVRAAVERQNAVVNAIGAGTLRKNTVESTTTGRILSALRLSSCRRYIGMSAGMVDVRRLQLGVLQAAAFRLLLLTIFHNIRQEHQAVEDLIVETELDWTILRPPRLTSGPVRHSYQALD